MSVATGATYHGNGRGAIRESPLPEECPALSGRRGEGHSDEGSPALYTACFFSLETNFLRNFETFGLTTTKQ